MHALNAVFVNCFPTLIAFAWPINIWHSCTMSKEVVWKHTRCVQNNHCRLQYIVTNAMWSWEIVSENRSVGVLRVLIPQVQIDEATRDDDHFRRGALAPRARPTNNNAIFGSPSPILAMDRYCRQPRLDESKLMSCATANEITAKIV